jgi:hypothetical protein
MPCCGQYSSLRQRPLLEFDDFEVLPGLGPIAALQRRPAILGQVLKNKSVAVFLKRCTARTLGAVAEAPRLPLQLGVTSWRCSGAVARVPPHMRARLVQIVPKKATAHINYTTAVVCTIDSTPSLQF